MQIFYFGKGVFKIKTKKATITTGDNYKIDDFIIPGPGEYEVGGIRAELFNSILTIEADEFSFAYLDKRKKALSDKELERLEEIDILFIPVGGKEVYTAKEALEIIKSTEPKIVIPMHYEDISEFSQLEEISTEKMDELKLKGELPEETPRRIVILNAQSK